MVSTPGARKAGGSTKFVPCTTSVRPANSSTGGNGARSQQRRSSRADTGMPRARVPCGNTLRSFRQPRSVNATARMSTSDIEASSSASAEV
jgi:hypothetical protein